MKNTKFELTSEKNNFGEFRIRALCDFGDVKKGDLGGFVDSESCLDANPEDLSWIYDNSRVCNGSRVYNNSRVCNGSYVDNNSCVYNSIVYNSSVENSFMYESIATINTMSISGQIWDITFTDDKIKIGCQNHTHEEWQSFTDDEISKMHNDALSWWNKWKGIIIGMSSIHRQKVENAKHANRATK